MIAKFKDGTSCTIRALLAFAEKCYYANFITLTEDCELLIGSIDRKANGRIRRIALSVMKPLVINSEKSSLYKTETKFEGNERSANDFLDDEVFSKGIRVDEDAMTTPPSLEDCIQLWSADQEKAIEAAKTLMSNRDPELLSWSTKWLLRSSMEQSETPNKSLDEDLRG